MTVKKYLADLYLTGAGSNSDPEKLIRKIKYYQEFLDVIGKVDRGYPPVSYKLLVPENYEKNCYKNIFIYYMRQHSHLVNKLKNAKYLLTSVGSNIKIKKSKFVICNFQLFARNESPFSSTTIAIHS